jgi:Flp pilus assembly CpaF family ATPase
LLNKEISRIVETLIEEEKILLSTSEKEGIVVDILTRLLVLVLSNHFYDPDISDILVNRYNQIYIENSEN